MAGLMRILRGCFSPKKDEVEDGCEAMDFLSRLPDDILSHILSLLKLEDAVRAKLLSHRWKHLFPANQVISFKRCECNGSCDCAESEDHKAKFVARVDQLMNQFRPPKIKAFELYYDRGNWTDCATLVDEWIRLACLMKPETIHLSLGDVLSCGSYTFPLHLLHAAGPSNLRDLKIDNCSLPPFSSLAGPMTSLRTLHFYNVCFHENSVTTESIASYFPNLETLKLSFCEQLTSMRQIDDFCGRLVYLKLLKITILESGGPEFFEIHNADLTNFTSRAKCLFSEGLKNLQEFHVELFGQPEQWSAAWLDERLLLMQDACEMDHVHSHLRNIRFQIWYFAKNEVELLIMLLKYATSLKKMTIINSDAEHLKELQSVLAPYFPRVNFITEIPGES